LLPGGAFRYTEIDAYDKRFLRHRSSPAVLKIQRLDTAEIFKIDAYDKRFLRHRPSPAVLKIQRLDTAEIFKIGE